MGKGEDTATEAKAEQESQETASGGMIDSAKEKLNTLTDKGEDTATEAKAQAEAKSEESSEPGFFDKIKSKVQELTSSDSDDKVKDEQFVSE